MAFTQDKRDGAGLSVNVKTSTSGHDFQEWGPIKVFFGSGSPDGVVNADGDIGSKAHDRENAEEYINTDGGTTWKKITRAA